MLRSLWIYFVKMLDLSIIQWWFACTFSHFCILKSVLQLYNLNLQCHAAWQERQGLQSHYLMYRTV